MVYDLLYGKKDNTTIKLSFFTLRYHTYLGVDIFFGHPVYSVQNYNLNFSVWPQSIIQQRYKT